MYKYLFSVRVDSSLENGGNISLDSFLEITPDEQKRLQLAMDMKNNEIWKSTTKEALEAFDVSHFSIIHGFEMRAHVNMATIHMVESEFQLTREDLSIWVKSCNWDSISKQKLLDSELRRRRKTRG